MAQRLGRRQELDSAPITRFFFLARPGFLIFNALSYFSSLPMSFFEEFSEPAPVPWSSPLRLILSEASDAQLPARLDGLLGLGADPASLSDHGESFLERCLCVPARPTALEWALDRLDPALWIRPSSCVDMSGLCLRSRPLESLLLLNQGELFLRALRRVAERLNRPAPTLIAQLRSQWRESLNDSTHPSARAWRLGSDWFHLAAACDAFDSVRALRQLGLRPEFTDSFGCWPLAAAVCVSASSATVAELLRSGADPDRLGPPAMMGQRHRLPDSWRDLGCRHEASELEQALVFTGSDESGSDRRRL